MSCAVLLWVLCRKFCPVLALSLGMCWYWYHCRYCWWSLYIFSAVFLSPYITSLGYLSLPVHATYQKYAYRCQLNVPWHNPVLLHMYSFLSILEIPSESIFLSCTAVHWAAMFHTPSLVYSCAFLYLLWSVFMAAPVLLLMLSFSGSVATGVCDSGISCLSGIRPPSRRRKPP